MVVIVVASSLPWGTLRFCFAGNGWRHGSKGEYRKKTVPVESFEPNPWGLYNVHGNVWEWTEDCWNNSNSGNPGDGGARTTGDCSHGVLRGGSWRGDPENLRSALRFVMLAGSRYVNLGFRLARSNVRDTTQDYWR